MSNLVYCGTYTYGTQTPRLISADNWPDFKLLQFCRFTGACIEKNTGSGTSITLPPEFIYCLDAPDRIPAGSTKRESFYNVFD